ncbi:hypothetical protein AKJ43_02425 [candidate division MSBL1 archaeon SCGC-AAA261D19]|uniref:Uncharacterized protein n=1 Tax=candidate division MSBL1 archaeon SCGC-AAA261D19 TaxID=1698273 RepID=A0A133V6P4_9EURY|nr:hypothetical protein AKJ43_02425 [candidate division MSBL1 archaeon SCGC-AAA261D19]
MVDEKEVGGFFPASWNGATGPLKPGKPGREGERRKVQRSAPTLRKGAAPLAAGGRVLFSLSTSGDGGRPPLFRPGGVRRVWNFQQSASTALPGSPPNL